MKIHLSQYAGFCFGVKRAVRIAHEHLKKDKDIYIIEDIVCLLYTSPSPRD